MCSHSWHTGESTQNRSARSSRAACWAFIRGIGPASDDREHRRVLVRCLRDAIVERSLPRVSFLARIRAPGAVPAWVQRACHEAPTAMPPSALPGVESWNAPLPDPIAALEQIMQQGGTTIVRAAFQYSFFAHPDAVRRQTPWYPERARTSREHYPGGTRGDTAMWQGRSVTLGDNAYAQQAWAKYTGRPIKRRSGFEESSLIRLLDPSTYELVRA